MRRMLLAPILLMAIAGCAAPNDGETGSDGVSSVLGVELSDFMLDPSTLAVNGPTFAIEVTNAGPTPHNLSIRGADDEVLAATNDLSESEAETLRLELEPGTYVIFCGLAGHESLGMRGELTVTGP